MKSKNLLFLNSFDYFRGIAILFIIAGHCWEFSGWIPTNWLGDLIVTLIAGGTSLFVFISGFLFHHIFYKKYDFASFMIKKIKNVLSPYIVLSTLPILFFVIVLQTGPYPEYFFLPQEGIYYKYIRPIVLYFLTGREFTAYWYIPFIMIVFSLSNLFIKYINLQFNWRMAIMLSLFIAAMVIKRPLHNIFIPQAVIYFTPVYMLGINASLHREKIYEILAGKEFYLFLVAILFAFCHVVFFKQSNIIDINIIQKSILCLLFMVFLHRFDDRIIPLLSKTADASFALFFIHPIVLSLFDNLFEYSSRHDYKSVILTFNFLYHPSGLLLYFIIIVPISFVIAKTVKRITGSYSRQIIGW